MTSKWLGDSEGFSFPSSFGFTRSASKTATRIPDDTRVEAVQTPIGTVFTPRDPTSMNPNDRSYQDGMRGAIEREPYRKGGPVRRAIGGVTPGPAPAMSARPMTRVATPAPMPGNVLAKGALSQHRGRQPMPVPAATLSPLAAPPPNVQDMQGMPGTQPQGMAKGGRLTAKQRHNLPSSDFALPGGRYPIENRSHAANAKARVSQFGTPAEKATVRKAVARRYPDLGKQ